VGAYACNLVLLGKTHTNSLNTSPYVHACFCSLDHVCRILCHTKGIPFSLTLDQYEEMDSLCCKFQILQKNNILAFWTCHIHVEIHIHLLSCKDLLANAYTLQLFLQLCAWMGTGAPLHNCLGRRSHKQQSRICPFLEMAMAVYQLGAQYRSQYQTWYLWHWQWFPPSPQLRIFKILRMDTIMSAGWDIANRSML